MKVSVDISYYPLLVEYVPYIKGFIERLNTHGNIIAKTNGMSTQVFGDYDEVMAILTAEIKKSFELPHSIFVMKVINSDLNHLDGTK